MIETGDFTSYNESIIRVNTCELLVDISSEIEIINDWVDKDELIKFLKSQVEDLKCYIIHMEKEMEEKNFHIRSLLIRESISLADDLNENNRNINNLFKSTATSISTDATSSTTTLETLNSSTMSISELQEHSCTDPLPPPAINENNLQKQLEDIRSEKMPNINTKKQIERANHANLLNMGVCDEAVNNKAIWKDNTTLIIGDSMLYGLEENKLKRKTKVRIFRGSTIEDMHHYVTPLLNKKPKNIILHVGTNNCVQDNSDQVFDKLIKLKLFINSIRLLLYFREHIPCKKIIVDFDPLIEVLVIEINLKKRKWLLISSYNPHKDMIQNHLKSIGGQLDDLCLKYEHFILIGDFNSEMCEDAMKMFCSIYNLKNLVKEPTCFKNVDNHSCIDLILTNKPLYFQKTTVIETGISDFHKLTVTTMKSNFQKQEPIIFNYRNYKRFNNDK